MSSRRLQDPPIPRRGRGRLISLPDATEAGVSSNAASRSKAARSSTRAAEELRRARAVSESWNGLSQTLREMATELANSRRARRQKEVEIEALKTEIARLREATGAPSAAAKDVTADDARAGRCDKGGAPRTQHEQTFAGVSKAVRRRGTIALLEENAKLRLELERLQASNETPRAAGLDADRC